MITVEVKGPAGSGKSAIAQIIAQTLQTLELNTSIDMNCELRVMDELQTVVDSMVDQETRIRVIETQVPHTA